MRGVVDLVALAEVAYFDCDVGHFRGKDKGSRFKVQVYWYISELMQNVYFLA
jgi:hypothetical protein